MPRASKRASDTRAPADTNAPAETHGEAEYRAAVEEGMAIVASISGKQWALGDLAVRVEKDYGENRLERFAEDINFPGAACTLSRYRGVCLAFPKTGVRPRFFISAQVLQAHPDRIGIVERNPDISKRAAREIMSKWRAEQAGTATPAAEADQDDDLLAEAETENAEQPEDEDLIEPEEDTAPTPTSAKQAKAKGPKKTDTEEEATLKENRSWLNTIVDIARAAIAEAGVIENTTPEQERQLALAVEPDLAPTVKKGSEALAALAAWYTKLSKLSDEAADTKIQEGHVKTSPKRASAPSQVTA